MRENSRRRYAIHFDLQIARLKELYSDTQPQKAYQELADFMSAHGFSHRQWSGYVSERSLTKADLIDFAMLLHETFPWLLECESRMDATVVSDVFDLRQMVLDSEEDKTKVMECE